MQDITKNSNCRSAPTGRRKPEVDMDHLPCAVVGIDRSRMVSIINRRAEKITGRRTRFLGKPLENLGKVLPFLPELLHRTLEGGSELRYVADSSSKYWLVSTCPHREAEGRVTGVLASIEDLSIYHARCEERNRKEKICLLRRITEQAAHELRNPLTAIKGFLQLHQSNPGSISWEVIWDELVAMETALDRLLAMSTSYAGQVDKLDLNQVVCDVYPSIHERAQAQRVWLQLTLPPNLGHITVEREKIRALVLHLCDNALNSMPGGGVLAIETLKKRRKILLRVTDTGTGIKHELLDRVFEPFFSTDPRKVGMGLTICQQVAQACGGRIKIESREGRGTVATVSLPQA